MADFRTHLDIVGASFSAVAGVTPSKRPFPDMGGRLRAAYLFGKEYGKFAPEAIGRALGPRYDWSGSGQHIEDFGRQRVSDYWLECIVSTQIPATPFDADTLIDDPADGVTLVAFSYSDATAKAVSLIRSLDGITTADPYISLGLQPQTSSGRVTVIGNNSGAAQATLNPLPDELGEVAMYAGIYTTASRKAFAKGPGVAIKVGTAENTSKVLTSTGKFEMGVETGSGTGANRLLSAAFYRGNLTADELEDEVYAQFAAFHTAISSGLTI